MRLEELMLGRVIEALAFLERNPVRNLRLAWALRRWGLFNLGLAEQGRYLAAYSGGVIQGLLLHNNQGLWRIAATGQTALELAERALSLWGPPKVLAGPEDEVEPLLAGMDSLAHAVVHREEEVSLLLREEDFRPCWGDAEPARDEDLEELVALEKMLYMELLGSCAEEWVIRSQMLQALEEESAALVRCDGHAVAKAEIEATIPWASELGGVFTAPGYRDRGFASAACTLVCSSSLQKGKKVRLETQRNNAAAADLYKNLGFKELWLHLAVRFHA